MNILPSGQQQAVYMPDYQIYVCGCPAHIKKRYEKGLPAAADYAFHIAGFQLIKAFSQS